MDSNTPARLLGTADAARYLGISAWTLRQLVAQGKVRRVSLPGVDKFLFDRSDLDAFVDRIKELA